MSVSYFIKFRTDFVIWKTFDEVRGGVEQLWKWKLWKTNQLDLLSLRGSHRPHIGGGREKKRRIEMIRNWCLLINSLICLVSMDTLLCWLLTSCWCVSDELWMEGWHEELCVKHVHTSGYVSPLWQEWSRARLLTAEVRRISLLPSWGLRSWDSVRWSPELRSKGAESWGWVMRSNYNQEKIHWGKMTSILSVVIASN